MILELGLGSRDFPSAAVAADAMAPRVHRASVHMEAMGLWRSSLDPAKYFCNWFYHQYKYITINTHKHLGTIIIAMIPLYCFIFRATSWNSGSSLRCHSMC